MKYNDSDILIDNNKILSFFIKKIKNDLEDIKLDISKCEKTTNIISEILNDNLLTGLNEENIIKLQELLAVINHNTENLLQPLTDSSTKLKK